MFQKSLEGQKWSFSKKFWGPLGYVLASSLVSKRWSKNQKSWPKIKKIKCFSEAPESYLKSFRPKIKFRALFSHRFMHFFIFHIFRIFSLHRAPFGPYHHFLILGGVVWKRNVPIWEFIVWLWSDVHSAPQKPCYK